MGVDIPLGRPLQIFVCNGMASGLPAASEMIPFQFTKTLIAVKKNRVLVISGIGIGRIGGPNGNRTRVSGVRGQRPRPLDDGTVLKRGNVISKQSAVKRDNDVALLVPVLTADNHLVLTVYWLGEEDSNPRKQVQSLSSYHWTIPQ
jgi:hypothetical protein